VAAEISRSGAASCGCSALLPQVCSLARSFASRTSSNAPSSYLQNQHHFTFFASIVCLMWIRALVSTQSILHFECFLILHFSIPLFTFSDYTAVHRPAFFASLKMGSTRMDSNEITNGEGLLSGHTADGILCLYQTGTLLLSHPHRLRVVGVFQPRSTRPHTT
jgi:hypothetical protein